MPDDWNEEQRQRLRPAPSTPPGRAGRRLFRRTLQPRRPLVYPDQWALVLLTGVAIVGGLALVVVLIVR